MSVTQHAEPAVSAPPASGPGRETDGRTAQRSLLLRLLARPEVGVFLGAMAVWVFFLVTAPPVRDGGSMANILYQSSTIGLLAIPVALLMIGGEFDLSAGVAVISSALTASMLAYQLTLNVWAGVIAALVVSLAIGFLNGWLVVRTGLPSFLITLGTFLILQGVNLAVTKLVTGNVATDDISNMAGFDQVVPNAVPITIDGGLTLPLTPLPLYALLKIVAFSDRKAAKDLAGVLHCLQHYLEDDERERKETLHARAGRLCR